MDNCIFCKIAKGEIPSAKIYEDDKISAFLELNALAEGHTLVVPKEHYENIFDIDQETLKSLIAAAQKISERLKETLGADGINFVHRSGVAAEQGVFHFHLHVIPRKKGDDVKMDEWWFSKARNLSPDQLESTAKKIRW